MLIDLRQQLVRPGEVPPATPTPAVTPTFQDALQEAKRRCKGTEVTEQMENLVTKWMSGIQEFQAKDKWCQTRTVFGIFNVLIAMNKREAFEQFVSLLPSVDSPVQYEEVIAPGFRDNPAREKLTVSIAIPDNGEARNFSVEVVTRAPFIEKDRQMKFESYLVRTQHGVKKRLKDYRASLALETFFAHWAIEVLPPGLGQDPTPTERDHKSAPKPSRQISQGRSSNAVRAAAPQSTKRRKHQIGWWTCPEEWEQLCASVSSKASAKGGATQVLDAPRWPPSRTAAKRPSSGAVGHDAASQVVDEAETELEVSIEPDSS
eukprot:TRINITY_DN15703_c0_g1_i1.p1 TRINITY_DN15703_c0_g1~~TRINITY_DN15703_c0_g1_i1.p1  ORF type:complete len:318 (-),score=44.66 TRINITY_DN15703_c0_g1_i1:291-1244(-)